MQSSTLVALRSLVMLICLVAVPLFALVGTDGWPKIWEKLVELRNSATGKSSPAAPQPLAAPAAPQPGPLSTPTMAAGTVAVMPSMPAHFAPPAVAQRLSPPAGGSPAPTGEPPVLRTISRNPAPPASAFWPAEPARPSSEKQEFTSSSAQQTIPASFNAPIIGSPNSSTPVDPIEQIRQRLEALGAQHYRLETAGQRGELFYFRCKVALPSNPNYHRYFEATETEALRAMQQVLAQAEAWRSGR